MCAADARSVCDSEVLVILTNASSVNILYFLSVCMGVDPGGWGDASPLKMWGITYAIYPPLSRPTTGYKYKICCHHMGSFKLRMHQNPFSAGAPPGPRWRSLRRSPKPRSRLGKGTAPPHSPPPRRLRRLDLAAILPCYKRNIRQS